MLENGSLVLATQGICHLLLLFSPFFSENSLILLEYGKIALPPLTSIVDPIMNLMNGFYHECERRKQYSPYFGSI